MRAYPIARTREYDLQTSSSALSVSPSFFKIPVFPLHQVAKTAYSTLFVKCRHEELRVLYDSSKWMIASTDQHLTNASEHCVNHGDGRAGIAQVFTSVSDPTHRILLLALHHSHQPISQDTGPVSKLLQQLAPHRDNLAKVIYLADTNTHGESCVHLANTATRNTGLNVTFSAGSDKFGSCCSNNQAPFHLEFDCVAVDKGTVTRDVRFSNDFKDFVRPKSTFSKTFGGTVDYTDQVYKEATFHVPILAVIQ